MKEKLAREQLRKVGLKVDSKGIAHDSIFDYIRFNQGVLITHDGQEIDLEDIAEVEFTESDRTLMFITEEGECKTVFGGKFGSSYLDEAIPMGGDMPRHTNTLNKAFEFLYPDCEEQLYYDELREREMIDMAMLGHPEMGVIPFNDYSIALYHECTQNRLTECGFVGTRYPSNIVMDEVLQIRVGNHRRNLFREWVESHEWDGKPRLRTCLMDYCGVTAPALQTADGKTTPEELQYIGDVTEAWFIGGIKRMYDEIAHEVVPVLVGGQGAGKTNALRFLSGDNDWYRMTTEDVANTDKFLSTVRGSVVVELGESKQIRTADNETLKAFISQSCDQLRKSYARYDETYPRHFIMIATSNLDNVFTDVTGSRRFYPMYCNPNFATKKFPTIKRGAKYQYEVEQIWAEALALYKQGHRWFVSRDTILLAKKMQKHCSVENPGVTTINNYLDDPINGLDQRGAKLTRDMIFRDIFCVDPGFPPSDAERMYRAWRNSTERWEYKTRPFYMNGKTVRGFIRTLGADDPLPDATFRMVEGDDEIQDEEDIIAKFRTILRSMGVSTQDDIIILDGVSDDDIEAFLSEGFIYNMGTSTNPEYHVGALP